MEGKEFDFKGGSANGFLMLLVCLISFGATIYLFVNGVDTETSWMIWTAAILLVVSIFISKGYAMQEPNEARVLMFFGKYVGTSARQVSIGSIR